jgi:hypothetical protein
MYVVISIPFVSLTLATFRRAELGFLGVTVYTLVQTPLLCGQFCRAGAVVLLFGFLRPFLTSWLIVGNCSLPLLFVLALN